MVSVAPLISDDAELLEASAVSFDARDRGSLALVEAPRRKTVVNRQRGDRASVNQTQAENPLLEYVDFAFTNRSAKSIVETIEARDPDAPFAYIVTPNVDHVVRLQNKRSDLWPAYRAAWMTLCDSRILARLARRVGFSLPVVPGSDLTLQMFEEVVKPWDRIAIVGGSPEHIAMLQEKYSLNNVQHYNPPMGFINSPVEVAKTVGFLRNARARYVFLAVGSPQQEILAYRVARTGGTSGVGFCVGASLNFLIGVEERAPQLMQAMGLEWLFRLTVNPKRMWKRYLVDGPSIFPIAQRWGRELAGLRSSEARRKLSGDEG